MRGIRRTDKTWTPFVRRKGMSRMWRAEESLARILSCTKEYESAFILFV